MIGNSGKRLLQVHIFLNKSTLRPLSPLRWLKGVRCICCPWSVDRSHRTRMNSPILYLTCKPAFPPGNRDKCGRYESLLAHTFGINRLKGWNLHFVFSVCFPRPSLYTNQENAWPSWRRSWTFFLEDWIPFHDYMSPSICHFGKIKLAGFSHVEFFHVCEVFLYDNPASHPLRDNIHQQENIFWLLSFYSMIRTSANISETQKNFKFKDRVFFYPLWRLAINETRFWENVSGLIIMKTHAPKNPILTYQKRSWGTISRRSSSKWFSYVFPPQTISFVLCIH